MRKATYNYSDWANWAKVCGISNYLKAFTFTLDTHEHSPRFTALFLKKSNLSVGFFSIQNKGNP